MLVENYLTEYAGVKYRVEGGSKFTVIISTVPLIDFDDEDKLKAFVDNLNRVIEDHVMPPMNLHLSGCARCRKTALHQKIDPCKTGIPIFQATKMNVMIVAKSLAESTKEARLSASNVPAS